MAKVFIHEYIVSKWQIWDLNKESLILCHALWQYAPSCPVDVSLYYCIQTLRKIFGWFGFP